MRQHSECVTRVPNLLQLTSSSKLSIWGSCKNLKKRESFIAGYPSLVQKIIAHIRFRDKIVNFSGLYCLVIPWSDLNTKKTKPNIEKWPKSLGVTLTAVPLFSLSIKWNAWQKKGRSCDRGCSSWSSLLSHLAALAHVVMYTTPLLWRKMRLITM